MEFREIDIKEILPQRKPMLMIDCLCEWSETEATTEFEIREDNIFLNEDGSVRAEAMLENVAQTCAARIGYYNKYVLHLPVAIGYIGEIKNCEILGTPRVGDVLVTKIKVEQEFFGVSLIEAEVNCRGSVLVKAKMKIAVKD